MAKELNPPPPSHSHLARHVTFVIVLPSSLGKLHAARLKSLILPQMDTLGKVVIRGCEYGHGVVTWVLNYFLLPSLHFHLMVNDIDPKESYQCFTKTTNLQNQEMATSPSLHHTAFTFSPLKFQLEIFATAIEEAITSLYMP